MATSDFDRVWEQVQSLAPEEQQELRERLLQSSPGVASNEDELDQELVAAGILAPVRAVVVQNGVLPFTIKGEPLSETVLQERR